MWLLYLMTQTHPCRRFEFVVQTKPGESMKPLLGLSPTTIYFVCEDPPELGTEVDVVLYLPENQTVNARATVLFRNRAEPSDIAVKLLAVQGDGQTLLRRFHTQWLQELSFKKG